MLVCYLVKRIYSHIVIKWFDISQILFVHIDTSDDASDRVVEFFDIESDDVPTCRLINLDEDMKKFVPKFSGIGADDIKDWVATYMEGDLEVYMSIL